MQGMTLPRPGSPREEWTDAESLAVELLNLASWLTQRTIYDADRNLRKGVALDETHFLSQVPTGKVLIDRLARDSRKFNVRALFASQLAGDLLRVSGFASLVNAVFVGRTDDEQAQAEALRLLRGADGGRLRADARHPVAAAAARRPARRHARASSSSPTGTAASRRSGSTSRRRTWSTCARRSTPTRTPAASPSVARPVVTPAAVRAPDEPRTPPRGARQPVAPAVGLGDGLDDSPATVPRPRRPGRRARRRYARQHRRPERDADRLRDDEDLDLLGDVDRGMDLDEEPAPVVEGTPPRAAFRRPGRPVGDARRPSGSRGGCRSTS